MKALKDTIGDDSSDSDAAPKQPQKNSTAKKSEALD